MQLMLLICLCSGVFGALVAGLIAGIWGVTGWGGFLYYLAMHMVVSLCSGGMVDPKLCPDVMWTK